MSISATFPKTAKSRLFYVCHVRFGFPVFLSFAALGLLLLLCPTVAHAALSEPVAVFTANPTTGFEPLQVAFQDVSSGHITGWFWDFGDGATSTDQHPSHTYTAPGSYTVSLMVTGEEDTAQVTLAWDAVTEPTLDGYMLYYGPTCGDYPFSVDVGNTTTYTVMGLETGQTYCFAVTAYDSEDESDFSNAVSQTIPSLAPSDTITHPNLITVNGANPDTPSWTDYQLSLTLRSDDDDALGVMFRYQDTANYYRFSWDRQQRYRRLMKRQNGVFTLLAQDTVPYKKGRTYRLEVVALNTLLQVWIDDKLIFNIHDPSFDRGTIALYSHANKRSRFDNVLVEDLHTSAVLLDDNFNDGTATGWEMVDEGKKGGPSKWSVKNGALEQRSDIQTSGGGLGSLGTYALFEASAP